MSKSEGVNEITKGVANVSVGGATKARRGSNVPAPDINRGRRRLSLMAGGTDKLHQLDGVEMDAGEKSKRASLKPVSGSQCYATFAKLSNVGFVPFNNSKVNQDRPMTVSPFRDDLGQALFGVFDGHGTLGHKVSQFVIDNLPEIVERQPDLDSNTPAALSNAFMQFNETLNKSSVDCSFSGTTAVMCYMVGQRVFCANSGDSRAVLARRAPDGSLKAIDLSVDQKPEREDEARRILASGGRVGACKGYNGEDVGPKRVWLKHQDVPGLAMTRSFGDAVAQTVGVTAKPEVMAMDLTPEDEFIVICSDGVWEFITSQECIDFMGQYDIGDKEKACADLVQESTRRWKEEEEVVDDTTVVIVYL